MMEDNTVFEYMIHTMELGVVIGIGVVVWYTKRKRTQNGNIHEHHRHQNLESSDFTGQDK